MSLAEVKQGQAQSLLPPPSAPMPPNTIPIAPQVAQALSKTTLGKTVLASPRVVVTPPRTPTPTVTQTTTPTIKTTLPPNPLDTLISKPKETPASQPAPVVTTKSTISPSGTQIAPQVADLLGKSNIGKQALTQFESMGVTVAPRRTAYVPESPFQTKYNYNPYQQDITQKQSYDVAITGLKGQAIETASNINQMQSAITQMKKSDVSSQWTLTYYIGDKRITRTVGRDDAIDYYQKQLTKIQKQKTDIASNISLIESTKKKGYLIKSGNEGYSFQLPKASTVLISKYGEDLAKVQLSSASFMESPLAVKTVLSAGQEWITGDKKVGATRLEELSTYALGLEESIAKGEYFQKVVTSPAMIQAGTMLVFAGGGKLISAGLSRLSPLVGEAIGGVNLGIKGTKIVAGIKAVGTELSPYVSRVTTTTVGKGLMKYGMFGAFEGQHIVETAVTRPEALGGVIGEGLFNWETGWASMEYGFKGSDALKSKWVERDIQKTLGAPELKTAREAEGFGFTQVQQLKGGDVAFKSDILIEQRGAPRVRAEAYGIGRQEILGGATDIKGTAIYRWQENIGLTKVEKIRVRELKGQTVDIATAGEKTLSYDIGTVGRVDVNTRVADLIRRGDLYTPEQYYKSALKEGRLGKFKSELEGDAYGSYSEATNIVTGKDVGLIYLQPGLPRTPLGSSLRIRLSEIPDLLTGKGSVSKEILRMHPEMGKTGRYIAPAGYLDATFIFPQRGEVLRHELIHGYQDIAGIEQMPPKAIRPSFFDENLWTQNMEYRTRQLASETMYFTKAGEPITYAEFQSGLPRIGEPTATEGLTKTQRLMETPGGRIDFSKSISDYSNVLADIKGKQTTYSLVFTKTEAKGGETGIAEGLGDLERVGKQTTIGSSGEKAYSGLSKKEVFEIPKGYKSKYEPKYEVLETAPKEKAYSGFMTKSEEDALLVSYGEKTGTRTKPKQILSQEKTPALREDVITIPKGYKSKYEPKYEVLETAPKEKARLQFTTQDFGRNIGGVQETTITAKPEKLIPTGGKPNVSGVSSEVTSGGLGLLGERTTTRFSLFPSTLALTGTGALLVGATKNQLGGQLTRPTRPNYNTGLLAMRTETGLKQEQRGGSLGGLLITPIDETGLKEDRLLGYGSLGGLGLDLGGKIQSQYDFQNQNQDVGRVTIQDIGSSNIQDLAQAQELAQRQDLLTRTITLVTPSTPTKPAIPRIPLIPRRPPDEPTTQNYLVKPQDEGVAFDVYVKERSMYKGKVRKATKFKKMNRSPLSYSDALSLGGDITDNTSAVSFRLKTVKGNPSRLNRPVSDFGQRSYKFTKKGETFIEKPDYRMDTPGELEQVSALGQEARRNKGDYFTNNSGHLSNHRQKKNYSSDIFRLKTPHNRSTGLLSTKTKIKETGLFKKNKRGKNNAYY